MNHRRPEESFSVDLCKNLSWIYLNLLSDTETKYFLAGLVLNIASSLVSAIMNTIMFYTILKHSELIDIVHPILCSISGAGMFTAMTVQPLHIINYYLHPKLFQYIFPCRKIPAAIFSTAFYLTGYGVLGSLALLSFYHLQAVSNPTRFRTRYTVKRSRKHVIYLWILETVVTLLSQAIFWKDSRVPELLFIMGASILALIVIAIQSWTLILLKIHNRNLLNPDNLAQAVTIKRARKMCKTGAMIFGALVLFCLPVVVAATISFAASTRDRAAQKRITDRETLTKTLLINLKILIFLFPATYPFILLFMNKKLAKAVITLVKGLNCCQCLSVFQRKSKTVDITVDDPVTRCVTRSVIPEEIPCENNNQGSSTMPSDMSCKRLRISCN